MSTLKVAARAAIPDREWVEFEVTLTDAGIIEEIGFKAFGCHHLVSSSQKFVELSRKQSLKTLKWEGLNHWDLLINEALLKLRGEFKLPIEEEELCHCRKITTAKVDNAVVMGALSPEKVKAWTSASSGCGTCRPNVEKLISYRTGRVS